MKTKCLSFRWDLQTSWRLVKPGSEPLPGHHGSDSFSNNPGVKNIIFHFHVVLRGRLAALPARATCQRALCLVSIGNGFGQTRVVSWVLLTLFVLILFDFVIETAGRSGAAR